MKNMDDLLNKYWEGSSKLSEEQQLKQHFSQSKGDQIEDKYFTYLENKKNEGLNSPDFDNQILQQISEQEDSKRSILHRINWKIAAAILLLIGLGILFRLTQNPMPALPVFSEQKTIDTFDDPQLAYEETKKALLLISSKLNKGNAYTAEFVKFSQMQEDLKKDN